MPVDKISYVTRIYHCDRGNGVWGEHAIVYILIIQQNFAIKPNSNELSEVSYIPHGELNEYVSQMQAPMEPILSLIYRKDMLHLWWKNLSDLDSVKNHKDIIQLDQCKETLDKNVKK